MVISASSSGSNVRGASLSAGPVLNAPTQAGYYGHQPRAEVRDRPSLSRRKTRKRSHTRLIALSLTLIVIALVGGYAFSAGLLPISAFNAAGSNAGAEQKYPFWPQNATSILTAVCSNETVRLWIQQQNFSATLAGFNQQLLTTCGIGQTTGGVVKSQQGLYLYQVNAESIHTSTTPNKKP